MHRIYLGPHGERADLEERKKMLRTVKGLAVWLSPAGPHMIVAEGVEKVIACMSATGLPGVAAGSSSLMTSVQIPLETGTVTVAADRGEAGEEAAKKLAARLYGEGLAVHVCFPQSTARIGTSARRRTCGPLSKARLPGSRGRRRRKAGANGAGNGEWRERTEDAADAAGGLIYRKASTIEIEPVSWLWPARFPCKRLSLLTGAPGKGKSQLSLYIAATVTRGGTWPDGTGCGPCGNVIILSAEDAPEDTIIPRLIAAGADLDRVFILEAVKEDSENGKPAERCLNLALDIERIRALAKELNPRLIVIDPISAYLGDTKSHTDASVRGLLAPLAALAMNCDVTLLAITHDRKSGGAALERIMGSLAFVAAPRAVWGVAPELDESGAPTGRNLMLRMKGNLSANPGGLAYEIEGVTLTAEHPKGISTSRIKWHDGAIMKTADEIYAATSATQESPAVREAMDWLREILNGRPWNSASAGTQRTPNG